MNLLDWIVGLLMKALSYVGAFFAGRRSKTNEIVRNDAKILEKQRDIAADVADIDPLERMRNSGF